MFFQLPARATIAWLNGGSPWLTAYSRPCWNPICVIFSGAFSRAECSLDMIIVNGQVEHAPRQATVRIHLFIRRTKLVSRATSPLTTDPFVSGFHPSHRVAHPS